MTVMIPVRRPDDPRLADEMGGVASIYVHIPFCAKRCPYCDFAVVADGESNVSHRQYVDAVLADMGRETPWRPIGAINFGGGTPSAIEPSLIGELIVRCRTIADVDSTAEISLEANPEDWSVAFGETLRSFGVNRITFGVQSLDGSILGALGRTHSAAVATRAIGEAKTLGFSVGADLIFGTPSESLQSWRTTVQQTIDAGIDHLSAYGLTVEHGTELFRAVAAGSPAPDGDDQADKYELTQQLACEPGLVQYEVSNYARPGHHCVYNLSTWAQGEYLGFGIGAHGHRDNVRYRNLRRIDRYIEAVAEDVRPWAGSEMISAAERCVERLFLGLRRTAGVSVDSVVVEYVESPDGQRMLGAGLIELVDDRLRITKPLLTDTVVRDVLSLVPSDC